MKIGQKKAYEQWSKHFLNKIEVPFDAIHCNNPLYDNLNHHKFIEKLCADIVSAILPASEICFKNPNVVDLKSQISGWNEDVKHLHDCARTAFQEWIADGRCIDSQIIVI